MELIERRREIMKIANFDSYGGLRVFMDNYYLGSGGVSGPSTDLIYNTNYFIVGPVSLLNSSGNTLTYTPIIKVAGLVTDIYARTYDIQRSNLQMSIKIGSASSYSETTAITTNISGYFLYFSVYKPQAANVFCQDNGRYIIRGSNV